MVLTTHRLRKLLSLAAALSLFSITIGCGHGSWPLWSGYAARFIDRQTGRVFSGSPRTGPGPWGDLSGSPRTGPDPWADLDPSGDQRTTSEGQAYALFFALAANDHPTFDRVLSWTQTHLAAGDLATHLPAWLWGKDTDGQWRVLDPNSASDADVWTAYTLLEAGRLWNSPSDTNLGRSLLALIAKNEVADLPGFGPMLLPGPTGFQHGNVFTINPSYLPLFLFQRLASADPTGPWNAIAAGIPRLLEQSARHGYAMDWVEYVPGDGFHPVADPAADPAASNPGSADAADPCGSYDAIRVYLWAGMINPSNAQRIAILNSVGGMAVYLTTHRAPPEKITDQGIPSVQNGPVGFSAALLPYLRARPDFSKAAGAQVIRLGVQRSPTSGLYGTAPAYYDQCLALFATGFSTDRFRFGTDGELNVEWKRG
jgi:endo-1,4-beta-D-glucanase Y